MNWEEKCYCTTDYRIIEEREDRYICICNRCGSEFTKWKQL